MFHLPDDWYEVLRDELVQDYYHKLVSFVCAERRSAIVFPAETDVFRALFAVPFSRVRVLVLGQDPYHGDGQADGLCFSVRRGTKPPPSLRNIFKELQADLGVPIPCHGDLTDWTRQGVLLLNAVLTVRKGEAASHQGQGWERFTDAIIAKLDARKDPLCFCLLGAYARKKKAHIDLSKHGVFEAAHPSPLSQKKFFGSRPFSTINRALVERGLPAIDWTIT